MQVAEGRTSQATTVAHADRWKQAYVMESKESSWLEQSRMANLTTYMITLVSRAKL